MRRSKTVRMSKEILKKTMAEQREERLDAKLKTLATEGKRDEVLAELDHFDENSERRHREHRDDRDMTLLDRQHCEGEYGFVGLRSLCRTEDWDEIIFSQDPEELYQLVEEYPVSAALRELTLRQKEILLKNIVRGMPTKDLAKESGCSVRNITKQRQRALEQVRWLVTGRTNIERESLP